MDLTIVQQHVFFKRPVIFHSVRLGYESEVFREILQGIRTEVTEKLRVSSLKTNDNRGLPGLS